MSKLPERKEINTGNILNQYERVDFDSLPFETRKQIINEIESETNNIVQRRLKIKNEKPRNI
jgi:Ser-tRNA(Ala) deacylase AlaX